MTLLLGQPKLWALFSMLLMHVFCGCRSGHAIGGEGWHKLRTYTTLRQAIEGAEVLSQTETGEQRGSEEEELHCEGCVREMLT